MGKYANLASIVGVIQIMMYQLELLSFETILLTLVLLVAICCGNAIDEFLNENLSSRLNSIEYALKDEWDRNKTRNQESEDDDF